MVVFGAGLAGSCYLEFSSLWLAILLPLAICAHKKRLKIPLLMIVFLSGLAAGSLHTGRKPVDALYKWVHDNGAPEYVWVRGTVVKAEPWRYGGRSILKVKEFRPTDRWMNTQSTLVTYFPGEIPPSGAGFEASLRLKVIGAPTNPGQFDAAAYYARRGIRLTGSCRSEGLVRFSAPHWWRCTGRYRRALEARLKADTGKDEGVLLALLLGERGLLTETQMENLGRSGLFHLVALSGLHVGLILLLIFTIAHVFGANPWLRDLLGIGILGAYGLLAAPRASLTRALLMAVLFLLMGLAGRQRNGLFIWSATLVLLLSLRPNSFLDTGFQLTFAATLSIILLWNAKPRWLPGRGFAGLLVRTLWIGFSAQVATLPLIIYGFHRVSPLGWIATPLASFPLMFIQVLGLPYLAGLAFVPGLHSLLGLAMAFGAKSFMVLPTFLGRGSLGAVFMPKPPPGWTLLYLIALLCLVGGNRLRRAGWVLAATVVVGAFCFSTVSGGMTKSAVVVFDVGEASCQMVHAGGKTILIDAGTAVMRGPTSARTIIEPFLAEAGIVKLDGIVLTHWDSDHSGAASALIRDLKVGFLAYPATDPPLNGRPELIASTAKRHGVRLIALSAGDETNTPGFSMAILHPDNFHPLPSENNRCLVTKLRALRETLLFTGDIEEPAESQILLRERLSPIYAIMAPHHGSRTSSTAAFIKALAPRLLFISCGRFNRFGHPAKEVLARYGKAHTRIYRTDLDGAILINRPAQRPIVYVTKNGDWISRLRRRRFFR